MSKTTDYIIAEAQRRGLTVEQLFDEAHRDLAWQEADAWADRLDVPLPPEERVDWGEGVRHG